MSKVNQKLVLKFFKEMNKPLSQREIRDGLDLGKKETGRLRDILKSLADKGRIFKTRKTWYLVDELPMQKAVLEVQRSGVGFAIPFDKRRRDIFIHPRNFQNAWNGDTILVATLPGKKGKSPEGRVVSIIERATKLLPVKVMKPMGPGFFLTRPANPRLNFSLVLEAGKEDLTKETMVIAEPLEQMEPGLWSGRLFRIMGHEHDLNVQEEIVKLNHKVPTVFPASVLKEAANLPGEPGNKDFKGRKDLRNKMFVTIDGAQAKDFDDAICVEPEGKGFVLYVAIADVSHYVQQGSKLDQEALARGNSYYFPLSVEPMFPESLSNGLCSLNPEVSRLVMTAQMHFDSKGIRKKASFYPGVIKSQKRLTYSQVNEALYLDHSESVQELKQFIPMLKNADFLARQFLEIRRKRGSIDFDLPEPEVLLNILDGSLEIKARTRNFAHQIVEEFMLAANEAVAQFLQEKEALFLYRVHPPADKDKLDSLFKLLSNTDLGSKLPGERNPGSLQKLIDVSRQFDMEFLVSRLVLRSMMQAKYSPDNEGHFGLASESYCHFTSPIRRYADLAVHRALKGALGEGVQTGLKHKGMKGIAESLSSLERVAMKAEREILKRATIIFLKEKIGQSYTGIISSLADFGFWVELEDVLAEGMVRLSTIHDDYYLFRPEKQDLIGKRTGKRFYLGQKVQVVLQDVNLDRLEVDFALK